MRTTKQYLDMPGDELALELAKVLTPGPWKHEGKFRGMDGDTSRYSCSKCNGKYDADTMFEYDKAVMTCPVPDPIKLDWATAMEWRDKFKDAIFDPLLKVMQADDICLGCIATLSQPRHYLIAAAMATGGTE